MFKFGFCIVCAAWASAAQAGLTLCNKGEAAHTVGLVYKSGKIWFSEGWWTIEPADCKVLVGGDLQQQEYYFTVKNSDSYVGQGYWFCAKDEPFELMGADGDCGSLGASSRDYALIDTGPTATSFTFDLAGSVAPSAESAALAAALPAEAMREHFTQGQQGEPFTITARLQGCATEEGYSACFVYAEGWRWAFDFGGNNNPAAMAAMGDLPTNTLLQITGDVLAYNDITVDALVSKISLLPADDISATLDLMQGNWVSVDDPMAKLSIYGSEQTDSYGGEELSTAVISFPGACPDASGTNGTVLVLQTMGMAPEDAMCYEILSIDTGQMQLIYLPRGNLLSYVRG